MPTFARLNVFRIVFLFSSLTLVGFFCRGVQAAAPETITFVKNGGWCWFEDPRAIVVGDKLFIGTIANSLGDQGEKKAGDVEVTAFDLQERKNLGTSLLHDNLQDDDHDSPAMLVRRDGRLLAMYAKHHSDNLAFYRISKAPNDSADWDAEQSFKVPAKVTYSNLFRLSSGVTLDFYRGENFNPNVLSSEDDGTTWKYAGRLIHVGKGDVRPYARYAFDGKDRVYFLYTDGHPRNVATSLYCAYLQDGKTIFDMAGKKLGTLDPESSESGIAPEAGTKLFAGTPDNRAWCSNLSLDAAGAPVAVYSVRKSNDDHRYRYARWDGKKWIDAEIAYAGSCLYKAENDYTGLIAVDPKNPKIVYISADVDPTTGKALTSKTDGKRHWEIFRGEMQDDETKWIWHAVTADSEQDNIRPIILNWSDKKTSSNKSVLLWLQGRYVNYTRYDLNVVGRISD